MFFLIIKALVGISPNSHRKNGNEFLKELRQAVVTREKTKTKGLSESMSKQLQISGGGREKAEPRLYFCFLKDEICTILILKMLI
jgi:hypothetical protein